MRQPSTPWEKPAPLPPPLARLPWHVSPTGRRRSPRARAEGHGEPGAHPAGVTPLWRRSIGLLRRGSPLLSYYPVSQPSLSALLEALRTVRAQRLPDHIAGLPGVFRLGDPGRPGSGGRTLSPANSSPWWPEQEPGPGSKGTRLKPRGEKPPQRRKRSPPSGS